MNSPASRRKIKRVLDPKHESALPRRKQAKIADTFGTRTQIWPTEQLENKHYALAEKNYQDALQGLYKFEPYTMAGLARAQFCQNKFSNCKATLDTLKENNPDFRNQDAHLLYARALENLDDIPGATQEYESLVQYFTGPEPHVHFAQLLVKQGNTSKAITLLDQVQETADLSAKHYTKMHKEWIRQAKNASAGVGELDVRLVY